jgi:hypothetical protein
MKYLPIHLLLDLRDFFLTRLKKIHNFSSTSFSFKITGNMADDCMKLKTIKAARIYPWLRVEIV